MLSLTQNSLVRKCFPWSHHKVPLLQNSALQGVLPKMWNKWKCFWEFTDRLQSENTGLGNLGKLLNMKTSLVFFYFLFFFGKSGVLTNPVSSPMIVTGTQMTSHGPIFVRKSEFLNYIGQLRSCISKCLLSSSVKLLLLTAISCLLNWVIHLVDISVSIWRGCCHVKRTGSKQTFPTLGGRLPSASCSSSCFLIQTERDISFFSSFFRLSLIFSFPLLAICLFLSVQLTTLIRQPDNESQREAMHLQLRLLSASAGRVCPSRTVCLCVFDCTLRLWLRD